MEETHEETYETHKETYETHQETYETHETHEETHETYEETHEERGDLPSTVRVVLLRFRPPPEVKILDSISTSSSSATYNRVTMDHHHGDLIYLTLQLHSKAMDRDETDDHQK